MRPFTLENARDTADAVRLASVGAAAQYLAGGTNLLDLMKLDVMRPERVVNISALRREHSAIEALAADRGWARWCACRKPPIIPSSAATIRCSHNR